MISEEIEDLEGVLASCLDRLLALGVGEPGGPLVDCRGLFAGLGPDRAARLRYELEALLGPGTVPVRSAGRLLDDLVSAAREIDDQVLPWLRLRLAGYADADLVERLQAGPGLLRRYAVELARRLGVDPPC